MRGQLGPEPVRAVAADDADHVAAADTEREEAERQLPHAIEQVGPAVDMPDAVFLLPDRDVGAVAAGIVQQELGRGVEPGEIGELHGVTRPLATASNLTEAAP